MKQLPPEWYSVAEEAAPQHILKRLQNEFSKHRQLAYTHVACLPEEKMRHHLVSHILLLQKAVCLCRLNKRWFEGHKIHFDDLCDTGSLFLQCKSHKREALFLLELGGRLFTPYLSSPALIIRYFYSDVNRLILLRKNKIYVFLYDNPAKNQKRCA